MKISSLTTTLIHIPYQAGAPTKLAGQSWSRMAILLVRVDTDEGVTGWGEGFGHAIAAATKATLDTMVAAHFIGRDARAAARGPWRSPDGRNVPAAASLRPQRPGDLRALGARRRAVGHRRQAG